MGDGAGIHVHGSASVDVLRAAELCSFGMVGVGSIFAAYRDGVLADDDEVTVMHGPEELGYPTVTEAMVNIRATLEQAVAEAIVEGWLASRLTEIGKARSTRSAASREAISRLSAVRGFPPRPLADLVAWLRRRQVDPKQADALEMVAAIPAHLEAGVTPLTVSYWFQDTGYHRAAARQAMVSWEHGAQPR